MGGITALLGLGPRSTRLQHSIGAMLLVRRPGGTVEEQAAALLHDISHTALSHVIDYALGSPGRQSFHDERKEAYLRGTEIPAICERHGLDWRAIADERRWPLVDQPAPRLCADRIDYTLRDAVDLGFLDAAELEEMLNDLCVMQNRIAFRSCERARRFAEAYAACDRSCWADPFGVGLYELTARALRRALEIGAIRIDDLWEEDRPFWELIHRSDDERLVRALALVSPQTRFAIADEGGDLKLQLKIRSIDPDVRTGPDRATPLSGIDSEWASRLAADLETRPPSVNLRILEPA
ncbi:hypothetical protein [Allosphingosinicella sp.]|uniref:hypothetical protein n=1 Tax=Allosphingosinicella sp. TaxID=2823234 RepID=UPI003D737788